MYRLPNDTVIANRYKIQEFLDEGGMQEVYVALDLNLSRKVALKTPKVASASKRFRRSATVSSKINHANVAKTFDYFWDSQINREFLIEELIEGKDLRKVFTENFKSLDPYMVCHIGHHLARGIAASHEVNVQHRDLKLSNIMISGGISFNEVKITDFGVAKLAQKEQEAFQDDDAESSVNASKTLVGAMPYIAPEVIINEGSSEPELKSDIWSLGAILHHLLVGKPPYGTNFAKIIIGYHKKAEPEYPAPDRSSVNHLNSTLEELKSIVKRCLSFDVSERPSAQEVLDSFSLICYQQGDRHLGKINLRKGTGTSGYGFILDDESRKEIFFHTSEVYGPIPKVGERVCYSYFDGAPQPRAFPIIKLK